MNYQSPRTLEKSYQRIQDQNPYNLEKWEKRTIRLRKTLEQIQQNREQLKIINKNLGDIIKK